jgi:hypothetical protein
MPRPIAAGVFGMQRMIGVSEPRSTSNAAMVVPAATLTKALPVSAKCR